MKTVTTLCAALFAAPFLFAQQDGAAPSMPNPKTAAHEPFAVLAGSWVTSGTMAAMPGVPGMETETTWTGIERAELICNGLWLKVLGESQCNGQTMHGLWLTGFDPKQKQYRGICVGSMDEPYMECEGSYDAATATWTWTGESPHGPFRSELKVVSEDYTVETVYLVEGDGKEKRCMRMERRRAGDIAVAPASASVPKLDSEPHALLFRAVGDWDVVTTTNVPGQGETQDQGRERVLPICGGKWFWSDFTGSMMGQPFEGHSLTGYDATKQQYVGVWLDSMSPTHALTWGTYDEAQKQWTFTGKCLDMTENVAEIHEVYRQPDANTRELEMTFTSAAGKQQMKMRYTRKPK